MKLSQKIVFLLMMILSVLLLQQHDSGNGNIMKLQNQHIWDNDSIDCETLKDERRTTIKNHSEASKRTVDRQDTIGRPSGNQSQPSAQT